MQKADIHPVALVDLEHDTLEPVTKLCRERFGRKISPATRWRWIRKGTRGGKLEAYCIAGVWSTTRAALADFIRRNTAAQMPVDSQSGKRSDETTRQLQDAGLV